MWSLNVKSQPANPIHALGGSAWQNQCLHLALLDQSEWDNVYDVVKCVLCFTGNHWRELSAFAGSCCSALVIISKTAWLKQEGGLNCPGKWWASDPAATLERKPLNQTFQKQSSIKQVLIHAFEQSGCRVRVKACCELLGRRRRSCQIQSVYAPMSFSHLCILGLSPNRSSQFSVARLCDSNNRLFVHSFLRQLARSGRETCATESKQQQQQFTF